MLTDEPFGGGVNERGVLLNPGQSLIDGFGGLIVVEIIKPALSRTGKELAARHSEPFRCLLDADEGFVWKRDGGFHALQYNPVIPSRSLLLSAYELCALYPDARAPWPAAGGSVG